MDKKAKIKTILKQTDFSNFNKDSMEQFIDDNIENINNCSDAYNYKNLEKYFKETYRIEKDIHFSSTDINVFLKQKFNIFIKIDLNKDKIIKQFNKYGLISSNKLNKDTINKNIQTIANEYKFLSSSITDFYINCILNKYLEILNTNKAYFEAILKTIENTDQYKNLELSEAEKNYIHSDLSKSLDDFLYLTFSNGFSKKIVISNSGLTNANEGDATQFLFISRAMLAGFNCSNVDLRSSRYDAVIDIKGKVLRVQVKGISKNSISFKDRDRGGEGVDPQNQRNKGKLISSAEIDIYVAVQKATGICYIIPATNIDKLIEDMTKQDKISYSCPISKLKYYKENWNIIYEVANN